MTTWDSPQVSPGFLGIKDMNKKNTVPRCVGFFAKDRLEELVDHDRKNLEQRQQT